MSTFTIRVTSSATNVAGTDYGQQPDLLAPSFLDMVVTNSTDSVISNGVYDAYCLNPFIRIRLSPTEYVADQYAGNTAASFLPIGFSSLSQAQVDQLNWLLAENFTSDTKFAGQFNYGEVQTAIWKIVGYTDAEIASAGYDRFLNDNNRNVVRAENIGLLVSWSAAAVASGNGGLPTDAFFSTVIDPAGNVQPLIVQLQSAKLGDTVWLDRNGDGLQGSDETGIDSVIVELYDKQGNFITSTTTGDDFSTAAVEHGFYQFAGLKSGSYQVKFVAPTYAFTAAEVGPDDAIDSDANVATGFSQPVTLAAGESNQTVDAGLYKLASLGDRVWIDANGNGQQDAGEANVQGLQVKLLDAGGSVVATQTTDGNGNYLFTGLNPGSYSLEFVKSTLPAGYQFTARDLGADASDSDADTSTGRTGSYLLSSGDDNRTVDAGLRATTGDLSITKTDGLTTVCAGQQITYTIVAANTGTATATNALVSDTMPTNLSNVTWTSVATAGAIDNQASGTGNINDYVTLAAGSSVTYTVKGTVAAPSTTLGGLASFDFAGNSALDGSDGNTRSFTSNGVTVTAKAFSRVDGNNGAWAQAYLGSYGGGLGVTDSSAGENGGANGTHRVDNIGGRDNYVLFQFSESVVVDRAYLQYVIDDSDISVWIGNANSPMTTLSDSVLAGMGFNEVNDTTLSTDRWADVNAGNYAGNTLVIAASTADCSPEDQFKIRYLDVKKVVQGSSTLINTATVTAPNGFTDTNASNDRDTDTDQVVCTASLGNRVWCDTDGDGRQDDGEVGISGVTVKLLDKNGNLVTSTTTDSNGNYSFANLNPGDYKVQFVKPTAYGGFTQANAVDDTIDSDADVSTGITSLITLAAGQNDSKWDAGLTVPKVALNYNFSSSGSNYSAGGVTVTASAFSRSTAGVWDKASLQIYSGGHGVTNRGEDGSSPGHTVDNVGGRIDYVVYQFSEKVVVDSAYLGYVSGDSDITAWIGSSATPLSSLSDTLLASMTREDSNTTSTAARTADINATGKEGNVLVIAASTSDTTPNDYFKIQKLMVCTASKTVTPIAIDLNGDGIRTVALADARGEFDLFGTATAVKSGWLSGADAFLVADTNQNGKIDDISELFGGSKQGDGFAKLISFDSNGDLVVNASDAAFVDLSVWRDVNGNHQTDAGELISLAQAGVLSLSVEHHDDAFWDASGNLHLEQSTATLSDGNAVAMTDVYFSVAANDAAAGVQLPITDPGWLFA